MSDILHQLFATIESRKTNPPPDSYTAKLFAAGEDEIVKKVGEEAIEVIVAAKGQGDARVVAEIADLIYHAMVLLASRGIAWRAVEEELARRASPPSPFVPPSPDAKFTSGEGGGGWGVGRACDIDTAR